MPLKQGIWSVKCRYERTVSKKRNDSKETVKASNKKIRRKPKFIPKSEASLKNSDKVGMKDVDPNLVPRDKKRDSSLKDVISRYEDSQNSHKKLNHRDILKEVLSPKRKKASGFSTPKHQKGKRDSAPGIFSHKKVGKVSTMNFVPESISNVIQNVQNNPVKRVNQRLSKNMGNDISSVLGKMHQSNPDKRKPVMLTLPSEDITDSMLESIEDKPLDAKMMTPKRPPKCGSNTSRASRKQSRSKKNTSR